MAGRCIVCGDQARARNRCSCCYQFLRRTGSDRTERHVIRLTERDIQRELERALEQRRRRARGWSPDI